MSDPTGGRWLPMNDRCKDCDEKLIDCDCEDD
jgi:hypothetical protein